MKKNNIPWISFALNGTGIGFPVTALCMLLIGISIATMVIRYMAMYDIYNSCSPQNSVVFLVLSILFSITEPFFLFFTRNKDDGMPPRKQPVYEQANSYDNADL